MRPWVRQGSVRDQQEMREVHALGSFPTVATSLGPGAAPLAFRTRLAAAGVGRSTGYRGVAWQELPCPAQKSPPRPAAPCLHRANAHSPLTKIPSVLFEYCSVSAGTGGPVMPPPRASRCCAVPTGEPAGCLGGESEFSALERHGPTESQSPTLVSSGSIGRPWKLATRKAAMRSDLQPL